MNISFIVTTYNIAPYIAECLHSLRPCLRPGDQLIVVDDGSDDTTLDIVHEVTNGGAMGPDIEVTIVAFGTNTFGGVGIAANIGLAHAKRDCVFFVDGDDYLIPDGFLLAREDFQRRNCDILICNYLEFDEEMRETKKPADTWRWDAISSNVSLEERRIQALSMIAVPWRKFYRKDFIDRNKLRFPEGDYFFEDNPFHWDVCRNAGSIGFLNTVLCHHRVKRPGQTMASTGIELTAFFTHYHTIASRIPRRNTEHAAQAVRWLIGNMSWHVGRLQPEAHISYARKAEETLKTIDNVLWDKVGKEFSTSHIWFHADRLRRGQMWDVIESWKRQRREDLLSELAQRVSALEMDMQKIRETAQAQQAISEFEALKDLLVVQEQA